MKYLFCIYRYCFVRLCEEEIWALSLSKVLKNDSQRDSKKRIADSNVAFSSLFNCNSWWLQVALVFQKLFFHVSCLVFQMHPKFQNFFVCIAVVACFLIDQNQTCQQLSDISIMEQWHSALAKISSLSNNNHMPRAESEKEMPGGRK